MILLLDPNAVQVIKQNDSSRRFPFLISDSTKCFDPKAQEKASFFARFSFLPFNISSIGT